MRLSEHCYAVTGLAYIPPWSVNASFVAGNEVTLIVDTGANSSAAATIHGYASAAAPRNRITAINTEQHFDHIGGNSYFRDRGMEVYGHFGLHRTEEEFRAEIAEFNEQITSPVRRVQREASAFYHETYLQNPTRPIHQETQMDLGDCLIEILFTPGHTPTNLSVWVPRERVLFCGDCLVNLYTPNLDCGKEPEWRNWLASLERIEQLAPEVVMPGHGPVVTGQHVSRLIASMREVLRQALAEGRSPTSRATTA